MVLSKQDGMTARGVAKRTAMVLLNGLQGGAVGVILGVVVAYVAPMPWLRNDPHRWYMVVLLVVVCFVSGAMYTFREPAWERSSTNTEDTADKRG